MRGILLMVAATIFAAACGDGGSDATPATTPTRTGTPTPTATPELPVEPCFEASALTLTARTLPGARVDVGWSGSWHGLRTTQGTLVSADLNCPDGFCIIDGSNLVGRNVGAPMALSAGGVSVCVLASFREAVTGTYDVCNGCLEVGAKLSVRVFPVGEDANSPCPAGSSLDDLDIDLNPLTTKSVAVEAGVDCVSDAFASGSCFCLGQVRPNACEPDGICPASGVCELGPIDSVCDGQPFRSCRSGTGTEDCGARFPGAGSCVDQLRPCFGSQVTRTGTCGTEQASLVAFFCIPATGADAIDSMVGLPGPGAITLPVSLVRSIAARVTP